MHIKELYEKKYNLKVLDDDDSLQKYGTDRSSFIAPKPSAVVFPKSIGDVINIVQYAYQHAIALVPSGGRTGLTGAACAHQDEWVVSFEQMDKIEEINTTERLVICQPGVILENLHRYVEGHRLFYPISLAAKGSCQIGGNIATNAGGINLVRYGGTRQWIAGMKVVTGKGELLDFNSTGVLKNNTGYALQELFIGSEGTLGMIVQATLRLTDLPVDSRVMLLGHDHLGDVLDTLNIFRPCILSAFELFDQIAMERVAHRQKIPLPLQKDYAFYSLIEFDFLHEHDEIKAFEGFEQGIKAGCVKDGVFSQNETQRVELWRYREDIGECLEHEVPYKYDVSVPISKIPTFYQEAHTLFTEKFPDMEAAWFGHVADGNLHINLLKPKMMSKATFLEQCVLLTPYLYTLVEETGGSISAEHGIGLLKKDYLHHTRSQEEIDIMRSIKTIFDPKHIMNPGKVFDINQS